MDFGLGLILSFTDNASAGINSATETLTRLTQIAEESVNSLNQLGDITALSALSQMADQVGDSFLSMGNSITGVFTSLFSQITQVGSDFESFRITLEQLYGSEKEAEKAVSKLIQFSAKTPFEVDDVKDMLIVLKSQGVDAFKSITGSISKTSQETLAWLGDIMAFKPDVPADRWRLAFTNFLGSGEAKVLRNVLDMGEIEDILGRDLGETPEARMQDLVDLAEKKNLSELMTSLGGTWQQVLSNMSDVFTQFVLAIADSGAFDKLKEALTNVTTAIAESLEPKTLNAIAKTIGEALNFILDPLIAVSKAFAKFITWIAKLVKTQPRLAKFVIHVTALAGALLTISGIALKLVSSLAGLAVVFMAMGGSFASVRAILVSAIKAIATRLAPLSLAIGGMYIAWRTDFGGIRSTLTEFANNVIDSFNTARSAVDMSVGDMANVVVDLQNKGGFWNNFTVGLMKLMIVCRALAELWNSEDGFTLSEDTFLKAKELGVLPLINAILDLKYRFGLFKEGFIAGFKEVSNSVKSFLTGLKTNVKGTFLETLIDGLTTFFKLLSSGDADAWYKFGETFGKFTAKALVFFSVLKVLDIVVGKVLKLATAVMGVGKIFKGLGTIIKTTFKGLGAFIKLPTLGKLFQPLIGEILMLGDLGRVISTMLKEAFKIALKPLLSVVKGFGKSIVTVLIEGIKASIGSIGSTIVGFISGIFSPLGAIIVAVLTPIIAYAITHWEDFKEKIASIWTTLKEEGLAIWNSLKEGFKSIWDNLKIAIQPIIDSFLGLKDKLVEVGGMLGDFIGSLVSKIKDVASKIKDFVSGIINSDAFQTVIGVLSKIGEIILSVVIPEFKGMLHNISTILQGVWKVIVSVFNAVVNSFSAGISGFIDIVTGCIDIIVGIITDSPERINQGLGTIIGAFVNMGIVLIDGLVNVVVTALNALIDVVGSILESILHVFASVWNSIRDVVRTVLSAIVNFVAPKVIAIKNYLSNGMENIRTTVKTIWTNIKSVFSEAFGSIIQKVSSSLNTVSNYFSSKLEKVTSTVSRVFNGIKDTISKIMDKAKDIVSGAISKITGFFSGAKLSFPKIKLPHFSIQGKFSLKPPSVPKFGVNWYAKGGVFDSPSVIGVGEDGQEAVMPLEKNTGWISVLASKVGSLINSKSSDSGALYTVSNAVSSLVSKVPNLLGAVTKLLPDKEDTPTVTFDTKPVSDSDGGGTFITRNYYETTENSNHSTGGDISNDVRFEQGSIVIQVSNASQEEAEKFAEIIMEKIKRKAKLDRMTNYKDVNKIDPEFAF